MCHTSIHFSHSLLSKNNKIGHVLSLYYGNTLHPNVVHSRIRIGFQFRGKQFRIQFRGTQFRLQFQFKLWQFQFKYWQFQFNSNSGKTGKSQFQFRNWNWQENPIPNWNWSQLWHLSLWCCYNFSLIPTTPNWRRTVRFLYQLFVVRISNEMQQWSHCKHTMIFCSVFSLFSSRR